MAMYIECNVRDLETWQAGERMDYSIRVDAPAVLKVVTPLAIYRRYVLYLGFSYEYIPSSIHQEEA